MNRRASPTLIGAFVLGAIALVIAGLLVFGGGRYFRTRDPFVLYFDDSVSGLQVGAPVLFRGVKVGQVRKIRATINEDLQIRIPVIVELDPDSVEDVGAAAPPPGSVIPELIQRGLRAQLQLQSLVTGLLYVELDFHPERPARFVSDQTLYPEIPTVPSAMSEVVATLEKLPIEELAVEALQAIQGIERIVNSPQVEEAIAALNETLTETRTLARNVNRRVGPLANAAEEALSIAGRDSNVRYQLETTLVELGEAARSIRVLADYLERHPEALVAGKRGLDQ